MANKRKQHGAPGEDQPSMLPEPLPPVGRRGFLKAGFGTMAAFATMAGVFEPLRHLKDGPTAEEFLRDHYSRLTPDMLDQVLRRVEDHVAKDYGAEVHVNAPKPIEGVEFAYALNLSRCNGSRRCVH